MKKRRNIFGKRKLVKSLLLCAIMMSMCCTGCEKKQAVTFNGDKTTDADAYDVTTTEEGIDVQNIAFQKADGSMVKDAKQALKAAKNDTNTVVWIMPYIGEAIFSSERLSMFNQQLKDEGEEIQLEICYLYEDADESYDKLLLSVLEQGYGDICNTGYTYTTKNLENFGKLKSKGYLRNLTEDLKNESGKVVKDAYAEYVWNSVTENGKIYTLPNQYFMPHRGYLAFSKKYFSKDITEKYDGKLADISHFLTKSIQNKAGDCSLIWGLSEYDTLNTLGIYNLFGVWGNEKSGRFDSAYSDENYKEILMMLHRLQKEGKLSSISDLENVFISDIENITNTGNFGIAVVDDGMDMELLKKKAYVMELPYYYKGDYAQGNALIQSSEKWEKAMKLYGILVSSKKDANLLVYGKEHTDYILKNGYAYDCETGEERPARYTKQTLGIADQVYNSRTDYFEKDVSISKAKFFGGNQFHESYFNGFIPDYAKLDKCMDDLMYEYEGSVNMWKEDDFEDKYEELEKNFAKKQKKLISQLNEQVGEWQNGK